MKDRDTETPTTGVAAIAVGALAVPDGRDGKRA